MPSRALGPKCPHFPCFDRAGPAGRPPSGVPLNGSWGTVPSGPFARHTLARRGHGDPSVRHPEHMRRWAAVVIALDLCLITGTVLYAPGSSFGPPGSTVGGHRRGGVVEPPCLRPPSHADEGRARHCEQRPHRRGSLGAPQHLRQQLVHGGDRICHRADAPAGVRRRLSCWGVRHLTAPPLSQDRTALASVLKHAAMRPARGSAG